jgi:hypothetical protein
MMTADGCFMAGATTVTDAVAVMLPTAETVKPLDPTGPESKFPVRSLNLL